LTEDKLALTFGALLHDIGKVVYRGSSAKGTHSKLGADFIEELAAQNADFEGMCGQKIVEQIRYHHAKEMSSASRLDDDSLAFVTYFADNISAGMDRKNEGDEQAAHFDRDVKLRKIFNIINGHFSSEMRACGHAVSIEEPPRHVYAAPLPESGTLRCDAASPFGTLHIISAQEEFLPA